MQKLRYTTELNKKMISVSFDLNFLLKILPD